MKVILDHSPTTKYFKKNLEDINKALGGAPVNRQVLVEL